jgi:hypothetical protein
MAPCAVLKQTVPRIDRQKWLIVDSDPAFRGAEGESEPSAVLEDGPELLN